MDLRKKLIDFSEWINENTLWGGDVAINEEDIDEYLKSINGASDETQADRQNEQTQIVCSVCNGSGLNPRSPTLWLKPCYKCQGTGK